MNSQSDGDGQAALTVRDITQHHVVSLTKLSFLCLLHYCISLLHSYNVHCVQRKGGPQNKSSVIQQKLVRFV